MNKKEAIYRSEFEATFKTKDNEGGWDYYLTGRKATEADILILELRKDFLEAMLKGQDQLVEELKNKTEIINRLLEIANSLVSTPPCMSTTEWAYFQFLSRKILTEIREKL